MNKIYSIGFAPLCNGKESRAPHIGNFVFILCWRCTGVIIGVLLAVLIKHYYTMQINGNWG